MEVFWTVWGIGLGVAASIVAITIALLFPIALLGALHEEKKDKNV